MTAFAGIVYPDALQTSDITELMLKPMQHRGKEFKQIVSFRNMQLGIIGKPLISNHKKDLHLAFDGFITSIKGFETECSELEPSQRGQLLLKAYEKYGLAFLENVDGDFAFAILDQKQGAMILARDRIGKKPLYWCQEKNYFLFGSELKAMIASGVVPQTPSAESIATYLYFGYSPQDLTPIKEVNKLLPSHYLHFSSQQGVQITPYWSYSSLFANRIHIHKTEVLKTINHLLEESVKSVLPEGSTGCFVSGGLGSATVAYYLSRNKPPAELKAFSVAFEDENEEDLLAAESACTSIGISQRTAVINPQLFLKNFPKIVWTLDEPVGDPNILATWKLSELAATFAPTVFSGMGSDELLAVHSRYSLAERDTAYMSRLMLLPKPVIQKILIPLLKVFYPDAAYNVLRTLRTNPWQFEYLRHNALFNESLLKEAAPRLANCFDPDTFLHKFHNISRIHSNVSSFLYFDVKTRLPDCFMLQYERMTRAHQLEWETPFLYRPLIEYAAQLPEPESMLEKETASYLKPLLRDVFSEAFINRPKKTRKQLLSSWIENQEVAEVFMLLQHGTLVETGLISPEWLSSCLENSETMTESFQMLFAVMTLEVWFRLFMNRQPGAMAPEISLKELLQSR
jgi:asparagine synthase (glutamine-hydrolysing)